MSLNINLLSKLATPITSEMLNTFSKCLIIVPHPDDESLACGGLIQTLARAGCELRMILVTDGSCSHPNSLEYPKDKLVTLRFNELLQALEILGLKPDQLISYNAPDSLLPKLGQVGFEDLQARMLSDLSDFRPDLVVLPFEHDPHCDHQASWQLVKTSISEIADFEPTIWEYPIWIYKEDGAHGLAELQEDQFLSLDIGQFLKEKECAIRAHKSQMTKLIDDDPKGFVMEESMIQNFLKQEEFFIQRPATNLQTLQPDYFEKLYQADIDPWNFENSEYEEQKYQATVAALPDRTYANGLEIGCSIGVLTNKLAPKCFELTIMDISETALNAAKSRLQGYHHIKFVLGGIPDHIPTELFDLIVVSEVGYYLSIEDLRIAMDSMLNALEIGGTLLLVHWTHFVKDYPLTGDQVHNLFLENGNLELLSNNRTADYRMDVFRKI